MAIRTQICPDRRVVLTRSSGDMTDEVVLAYEGSLGAMPGFDPDYAHLVDARALNKNSVTPEGMLKLAEITPFHHYAKRCYVVSSDHAHRNAALFGAAAAQPTENFFVTTMLHEGYAWLGIDPLDTDFQETA